MTTKTTKGHTLKGWILYRESKAELKPESYEMHRFLAAAERRGVDLDILRPAQLDLIVTRDDRKSIRLDGRVVALPDFVIPRLGAGATYFALATIRQLERLGVTIINAASAIETVKDKLYTQQILAASQLPVPKTMLAKFPLDPELVGKQLGFPVVVKTLSGSKGSGVYLAETEEKFTDLMTLLESTNANINIIFQEFIAGSHGHDLRVFMIGGRAVACMERVATDGSFKANISRGGEARPYPITPEIEMVSIEATRQVGLDIAGVDLLFDADHFKVCEVNSSPGFKGIEKAFPDIDIADMILQYVEMRLGVFAPIGKVEPSPSVLQAAD
jgi:gamma-F420-2:alpha-L-glutamate ligase